VLVFLTGNASPEIRQAKKAVKDLLRNAESAHFEGMIFKADEGCVHGSVKLKNTLGGYAGKRRILYDVDTGEVGVGETNLRYLAMIDTCLRKALK